MRAIAELLVDSSICLNSADEQLALKHPFGRFEVVIQNNPKAGPFARNALRMEMIFEVDCLDNARDAALDNAVILLNALARTTGARFDDITVVRALDWTPGLVDRQARYYATTRINVSVPGFDKVFADTTERVMAMHDDDVSQTVMRWYRLGRRAEGPEEQFMYLWFAVEVAAGALKEAGKIAHKCPKCGTELYCPTCANTPTRRRFETEAIKDLICSVCPPDADHDELFSTLAKIRNTLQHGRRFNSIVDQLPCTQEQALDVLAHIAWRAVTRLGNEAADPMPDEPLTFAMIEGVQNNVMVMSSVVGTRFEKGDPNNPVLSDAPDINISMVIDGKNYSFDGQEIEE
jgi:hypothetical protein